MTKTQLIGLCDRILAGVVNRFFGHLPAPVLVGPVVVGEATNSPLISLKDLLDGILYATPKHRTPRKKLWAKKYGNDNWNMGGTRLFKSKRNITTCSECGTFHEYHTICRSCFKKVQDESLEIIEQIRTAWSGGVIDREVKVVYKGENAAGPTERIVEIDKPRPLWFAPDLSQKTARPIAKITGPTIESEDRTIKIKE